MTNIQRSTALAGYLLGCTLGVIRFVGTRTVGDAVLAGCLMVAEFAIVRLVEKKSARWEVLVEARREKEKARGQQESLTHSTADELERRQRLLDETAEETRFLEDAIQHDHLMCDAKTLQTIAVNAVRGGYHAGISRNFSDLGGNRGVAA